MERYVATMYRLHELHVCVLGGYVPTTYPKFKLNATYPLLTLSFHQFYIIKSQFHRCSSSVF